jgi:AcrR family transcriptional regulator
MNCSQEKVQEMQDDLINIPRTKRGRMTLNNILSAAIQVFYEKGYHSASINDITSLAGVASGTFYVYFDSKYNLYKYLLFQCSHKIRKFLSQATSGCKTRLEVERVGLKAWLEFIMENQYMYHIIWESMYIDYSLFVQYYETFCAAYKRGLEKSKAAGELGDIDTEVLAYILMGITNFLGLNWCLFKRDPSAIDHVVDEFMKILEGNVFKPEPDQQLRYKEQAEHSVPPKSRFRFEIEVDDDEGEEEDGA